MTVKQKNKKLDVLLFKVRRGSTAVIIDERTGKRYPVQVVPKGLRLGRPVITS